MKIELEFNGDSKHDMIELIIAWDKFKKLHESNGFTIINELRKFEINEKMLKQE